MQRASYRFGVEWIAYNDDAGTTDESVISCYVSTCLLADLFEVAPAKVAKDIARKRRQAFKALSDKR